MSPKMILLTSVLICLDVVYGLDLRVRADPLGRVDGGSIDFSVAPGLFKRQTGGCPIGYRECARVGTQVTCAGVCCFEDGVFSYGCNAGFYCDGTGEDAGCCRNGRVCVGGPPPCVDNGEPATSPTEACPIDKPVCTANSNGAPVCLGRGVTLPGPSTSAPPEPATTTGVGSGPDTSSGVGSGPDTTSGVGGGPSTEPTTTEGTTSVVETSTPTSTTEIPVETTTAEATTTEVETTTEIPTITSVPTTSGNATITIPPPATSNSGRTSTVNLMLGLISIAFTFFLC